MIGDRAVQDLREKPFRRGVNAAPPEVLDVPGMLSWEEKQLLYYVARHHFTGEGVILDLGTFLGGSAMCFASGVRQQGLSGQLIHSYDVFKLGTGASQRYFPEGAPPDLRTRHKFDEHLGNYLDLIVVHEGDVLAETWDDAPVEIMFVDVAKSYRTMDHLLSTFFPALIPGRSLIIVQDYLWGTTGPWHHVVMEKLSDYVEYVVDTEINSVVFLLRESIPEAVLRDCRWGSMEQSEKLRLMDQAIAKLDTEEKKDFLRQNRQILVEGKDMSWGMMYHEAGNQSAS